MTLGIAGYVVDVTPPTSDAVDWNASEITDGRVVGEHVVQRRPTGQVELEEETDRLPKGQHRLATNPPLVDLLRVVHRSVDNVEQPADAREELVTRALELLRARLVPFAGCESLPLQRCQVLEHPARTRRVPAASPGKGSSSHATLPAYSSSDRTRDHTPSGTIGSARSSVTTDCSCSMITSTIWPAMWPCAYSRFGGIPCGNALRMENTSRADADLGAAPWPD